MGSNPSWTIRPISPIGRRQLTKDQYSISSSLISGMQVYPNGRGNRLKSGKVWVQISPPVAENTKEGCDGMVDYYDRKEKT